MNGPFELEEDDDDVQVVDPDYPRFMRNGNIVGNEARLRQELQLCQNLEADYGIIAKARRGHDGTIDIYNWICATPGKAGTPWVGGLFKFNMRFSENYPEEPPICQFKENFFHPNVAKSGRAHIVMLDNRTGSYHAGLGMEEVLREMKDFLAFPSTHLFANLMAKRLYDGDDRDIYYKFIEKQTLEYNPVSIQTEIRQETHQDTGV
ncbi:hypothetical protein CAEBREN_11427 [Caenorhabditis brenneri]|uniref:UBC core domain-containing protein n=1 Tax=Caenorhabditis brenneri TaxID=135651 RepID=G0M8H9_CAEBE|nr:hypothetical protein CAEBREN_11427 [Caenorhabditis brenneri]